MSGDPGRGADQPSFVDDALHAGDVFGFQWVDTVWIPAFQFDARKLTVEQGPQQVVAELGRSFDGWALASWFVRPNSSLAGCVPIECVGDKLLDVLEAARVDRFVATG